MMAKRYLLFLIMLLTAAAGLFAGTTGKISGRIVDAEKKEPLPGVNVFLDGTAFGAVTDVNGNYFIINIPPGKYTIVFRSIGYKTKKIEGASVSIDATTSLSTDLTATVIEGEEVVVRAERPLVQKDLTSTSARVSSDDIDLLPVESTGQIVNLQAGVIEGHFRGGRLGEVSYMIDGIAVNDGYSGGQMIDLQPNSIQEVEVISGTFNAEYGQAMSGVVNIVSKEPNAKFSGQLSGYTGAYLSNRRTPFVVKSGDGLKRENYTEENRTYLDLAKPGNVNDLQGNLSGPLGLKNLLFFTSFRYHKDDGAYYGKRIFVPSDSSFVPEDRNRWRIDANGDGAMVPMNWSEGLDLHAKMIAKPFSNHKLTYEFIREDAESQGYEHRYKYNPDGRPTYFSLGNTHMVHYDYVINKNGFINLKFANFSKNWKSYVFESPYDLRYVPDTRLQIGGGPHFYMAGTNMNHSERTTTNTLLKGDLTYQFNQSNQIKLGFQSTNHKLNVTSYTIRLDRQTDWKPQPVEVESPAYVDYVKKPFEISAYIQDRLEWSYFIMNIGLRYDRFEPRGVYPADLSQPSTSEKIDAKTKSQWSPRFGIAMPLTEKSVLHLSYGLFFQMPAFNALFLNPDFKIPVTGGATIGNANLEPEKTATYEVGLQHGLNKDVAVNLTVYYKDIRNLLGMETYILMPTFTQYARYVNRDYGQVLGFTASLEQRSTGFLTTSIDYTFQIAEGNASDPADVWLKSLTSPPTEITKQLVLLDWDRSHTLNLTATAHNADRWNLGIIGTLASGFPYTPESYGYYYGLPNGERKPFYINFDLNFAYTLKFGGMKTTLFTNIYNVLDIENSIAIYTDSGNAQYTRSMSRMTDDMVKSVNTINDYYYRPDYRSTPRKVLVGLELEF